MIYSVEAPDDRRTFHGHKATALGLGRSLSSSLDATVVVRAHELKKMPYQELACALLNATEGVITAGKVIGWFSSGKRRPQLEDRE